MKKITDGQSFILKPSTLTDGGVGVFVLHDIAEGAHMTLFLEDFEEEICDPSDVPEELRVYCLGQEDGKLLCPKFFNSMDIGNYINHSIAANMRYEKGKGYFATRDIEKGEELFANYNQLGEPEETREDYYQS